MSKQLDIRKGIEMIIDKEINRGEAIGETWFHGDALSDLLSFLHSQGVVLKVDNIRYVTAHKDGGAFIETVAVESIK